MNAKIGVAAIVAALFVAFGAFAMQGSESAKAGALPPLLVYTCTTQTGPCSATPLAAGADVATGTWVRFVANFGNNQNPLNVQWSGGLTNVALVVSGAQLYTPYPVTLYSSGLPNANQDVTPLAQDDNSVAGAAFDITAATMNAIGTVQTDDMSFEFIGQVSCTSASSPSITQNQSTNPFNDGVNSLTFTFDCVASADASTTTLSVKKIDQFGNLRSAVFAIQQEVFAGQWITVATMQVGSTSNNPCLSTAACTTNPSVITQGVLPPAVTGAGVTLASGTYRVIEIGGPATGGNPTLCTLVEVRDGDTTLSGTNPPQGSNELRLQPVTVTIPGRANDNTLTFVNSCVPPGGVNATNSAMTVVIGGATAGLTNRTHVEIVPAPGSDDDARVDIRVRDANGINIPNAHVTVIIDKGALALRTDTAGSTPAGYDPVEPSPASVFFGLPTNGDTCDQAGYYQLFSAASAIGANAFTGNNLLPFFTGSRRVQDGFTNADGVISACVYASDDADPGITPGKINIQAVIETPGSAFGGSLINPFLYSPYGSQNIILTQSITVVGPPASVTVTAAPTSLLCGEKATITADVKDSIGQAVSDHTRIELVSNQGSTIGGTGATLGFPGVGPVNPVSSSAAETFSGKATAFLLTSTAHVGAYEVVVATGGSTGGFLSAVPNLSSLLGITGTVNPAGYNAAFGTLNLTGNVGAFSTAPVSAQVTVTCSLPAAPVAPAPVVQAPITAPRTGEGIRPPNTGDAGLADASGSSSWALVIAGVVVAFAGVATVKAARR